MKTIIGTYSNCGGYVTRQVVLWGGSADFDAPSPECEGCGSVAESRLPIISMREIA